MVYYLKNIWSYNNNNKKNRWIFFCVFKNGPNIIIICFRKKKQEELERKEEELARREEEWRSSSYNVRRNNWPPLPEQCCFQPCFYQDIQVDIRPEFQKIVRKLYYLWICKYIFAGLRLCRLRSWRIEWFSSPRRCDAHEHPRRIHPDICWGGVFDVRLRYSVRSAVYAILVYLLVSPGVQGLQVWFVLQLHDFLFCILLSVRCDCHSSYRIPRIGNMVRTEFIILNKIRIDIFYYNCY